MLVWNKEAEEIFDRIIDSLPQFHRSIAKRLVKESAEEIARSKNRKELEKEDLIQAFFKEVPPAFKEMMKRLFTHHGIDYSPYVNE